MERGFPFGVPGASFSFSTNGSGPVFVSSHGGAIQGPPVMQFAFPNFRGGPMAAHPFGGGLMDMFFAGLSGIGGQFGDGGDVPPDVLHQLLMRFQPPSRPTPEAVIARL
jgi:hypothetical protein